MTKKVIVRLGKLERLDTWKSKSKIPAEKKRLKFLLVGRSNRATSSCRSRWPVRGGSSPPSSCVRSTAPGWAAHRARFSAECAGTPLFGRLERKSKLLREHPINFSSDKYDLFFRYKICDWSKTRFASGYFFEMGQNPYFYLFYSAMCR